MPFSVWVDNQEQATLDSAGETTNDILTNFAVWQYTLSSVGTNVVMRMEKSVDGTTFVAHGSDATQTVNGTYQIEYEGPAQHVRLKLLSISVGTPSVAIRATFKSPVMD